MPCNRIEDHCCTHETLLFLYAIFLDALGLRWFLSEFPSFIVLKAKKTAHKKCLAYEEQQRLVQTIVLAATVGPLKSILANLFTLPLLFIYFIFWFYNSYFSYAFKGCVGRLSLRSVAFPAIVEFVQFPPALRLTAMVFAVWSIDYASIMLGVQVLTFKRLRRIKRRMNKFVSCVDSVWDLLNSYSYFSIIS
jgi:hypothetical protein